MKKLMIAFLAVLLLLSGCGATRTVACDGCGEEIKVKADSNITDSWIVYCKDCELSLFGEDGLIAGD